MSRSAAAASTLTAVFAVLCVTSAALQYNDPDPIRWAALYLAAGGAAVAALARPTCGGPRSPSPPAPPPGPRCSGPASCRRSRSAISGAR
ncbi:MAG: hypothetical protein IPH44_14005 [Myxococcales bacterium]|nr:hypothetical protein [Myxococcales bacterium]